MNLWLSDARYIFAVEDTDTLYALFSGFSADKATYSSEEEGKRFHQSKDEAELKGLLDAILADCAAGKMEQQPEIHYWGDAVYSVRFGLPENLPSEELDRHPSYYLQIWSNCTNTVEYLDKLFAQPVEPSEGDNFRIG